LRTFLTDFSIPFTRFWDHKGARYFLIILGLRKEKSHKITNQLIINHKKIPVLNI